MQTINTSCTLMIQHLGCPIKARAVSMRGGHLEDARHGGARLIQHQAGAAAPDTGHLLARLRLVQQLLAALRYLRRLF